MGYSTWWYSDGHLLVIGMAWATYEEQIIRLICKYYKTLFCAIVLLLIPFQCIRSQEIIQGGVYYALLLLVPILVVLLVNVILLKSQLKSTLLDFLGKISLEIYLVQGLAIKGLRNDVIYINNVFLWGITVVICTFAAAVVLHYVSSVLLNIYGKCFEKLINKYTPKRG